MRGTLPAAAELLDGALDVGLGHPEFSRPTGTVALKPTPATLLAIEAQRLAENFGLRPTFLLGKPFRFADYVRRERERADSGGGHLCSPRLRPIAAKIIS